MNPFLGQQQLTNYRRTWGQRLILMFNIVLIAATLSTAGLLTYAGERASSINRVALDRSLTELDATEPGQRVINVLLVGSDSSANLDPDDPIQIGRQGEHLGDVIIVAHLDERSGQVALLSLPRDLWIPISGTKRSDRINRAFLTGGPATLIDTIEEAFGIPIHHYVNVDFAGFQGLVEAVGTVEVDFATAARDWNANASPEPRSQTGFLVATPGCHSLGPDQALAYVRSRYYQTQSADGDWQTDPSSDLGRIRRQQDFLERLLQKAIDQGARNPLVLRDLIDAGIQNVAIDQELTPSLLVELSSTYRSFEPGDLQTYTFPVSDDTVGANRVLMPHFDQAQPILELFDGAAFDSPSTVAVDIVYDPQLLASAGGPTRLPDEVAALVEALTGAGFVVGTPRTDSLDGRVEILHSRDGAGAAQVVASTMAKDFGTFTRREFEGTSGRNVVIAVGVAPESASGLSDLPEMAWQEGAEEQKDLLAEPKVAAEGEVATPAISAPEGPTLDPSTSGESASSAAPTEMIHNSCGA